MAVYFTVSKRTADGRLQLSIDDNHSGYRIAGPKFNSDGEELLRHEITKNDAKTIGSYLKEVRKPRRRD